MTPQVPVATAAEAFSTSGEWEYVTHDRDSGWDRISLKYEVTFAADANKSLPATPTNVFIDGLIIEADDGFAIATGTHLGVGISGDLDLFDEIAAAGINAAGEVYYNATLPITPISRPAATTILLATTNGSAVAAGSGTGTLHVHVMGRRYRGIVI